MGIKGLNTLNRGMFDFYSDFVVVDCREVMRLNTSPNSLDSNKIEETVERFELTELITEKDS